MHWSWPNCFHAKKPFLDPLLYHPTALDSNSRPFRRRRRRKDPYEQLPEMVVVEDLAITAARKINSVTRQDRHLRQKAKAATLKKKKGGSGGVHGTRHARDVHGARWGLR